MLIAFSLFFHDLFLIDSFEKMIMENLLLIVTEKIKDSMKLFEEYLMSFVDDLLFSLDFFSGFVYRNSYYV